MTESSAIAVFESSAVLDFSHLSRQTAGDLALECELLELFKMQAPPLVAHICDLSARPALAPQLAAAAHKLKGSALAIGAFALAEAVDATQRAHARGASGSTAAALGAALVDTLAEIDLRLSRLAAQAPA